MHSSSTSPQSVSPPAQDKTLISRMGPLFVAVGASLWGTETLWRVFLNKQFTPDVLVFYEHLYCLVFALPILWLFRAKLKGVSRRTWLFLIGSGVIGSAVGTFFFTASLHSVNLSVANVLLNIQPLFSAVYARYLLGERFGKGFFLWAVAAILSGALLSLESLSLEGLAMTWSIWMVLVTALCWSFGTVAGRGVNLGMSFWVASPLRFAIGLVAMGAIVVINGHANLQSLNFANFSLWHTHQDFLLLSLLAGVLPLFLYFKGLSLTQASVAAFFEMFQIIAALCVTWGFFGQALSPHQLVGAVLLCIAAFKINRIQGRIA
jgi:drug/metabolite transporter (DMT)-like permease